MDKTTYLARLIERTLIYSKSEICLAMPVDQANRLYK